MNFSRRVTKVRDGFIATPLALRAAFICTP